MVTLEVAGLEQPLGWRRANDHDAVAFSEIGGMALGLYGR